MKSLYEFGSAPFRDELMTEYIVPAARWILGEANSAYLLPQYSGSNWECALGMQFLLELHSNPAVDDDLRELIRSKCVQTARWVLGRAKFEAEGMSSWDGVSWDTAVCARVLLSVDAEFGEFFAPEEKGRFRKQLRAVVRWLVEKSVNWNRDVRYSAGPPDLAQVLLTLTVIAGSEAELIRDAERTAGMDDDKCVIDHIVRVLLAMEERTSLEAPDGVIEMSHWVDCFNSSEVLEALTAYVGHCSKDYRWGTESYEAECNQALIRCLRYIEVNQSDGTWGGVADTCGTLYGYLRVTGTLADVGQEDHVIFKALRWMCDEKQALSDGSFLHTSYVTVFYSLALWEAYARWPLALSRTTEVYDVALWSAPVRSAAERSRRLELELKLADSEKSLKQTRDALETRMRVAIGVGVFFGTLLFGVVGLFLGGVLMAKWKELDIDVTDASTFWTVAGIGIPLALSLAGGTIALRSRT